MKMQEKIIITCGRRYVGVWS